MKRHPVRGLAALFVTLLAVVLPAGTGAQTIPSPAEFFGHEMGADRKLARWDRLVEYYETIGRESDRVEVWINLAHAHLFLGQQKEALEAYSQALRVNPYQRQPYIEVLMLLLKGGDEANAERVLQQAIAHHPREAAELRAMYGKLRERVDADRKRKTR